LPNGSESQYLILKFLERYRPKLSRSIPEQKEGKTMNERFGDRDFRERGYGDRGFGDRGGSGGGFGGRPRFVPVKEGEEIDVKIEGIAAKGDGVAKKEGFVIFVPGAKLNEEVRIKITKVARKVAFAEKIGAAQGPVAADTPRDSSNEESGEDQPVEAQEEAEEKKEEEKKEEEKTEEGKKEEAGEDFDVSKDSEEF